jgi:hypothetical protein
VLLVVRVAYVVRVIHDKSIAFVRYKLRAAAEFAKEAMTDQSLGYKEVLNVRWANDDPNPRAQQEQSQGMEEQVRAAVLATYGQGLYPDMHELNTGDAYPNTDTQYLYTMPPVPSAVPTSSTDTSASTCSESLPLSQVDETETAPPVDQQQQYTKEQWRAWYQYYYGYVPQGLEEEDKSQPTATGP